MLENIKLSKEISFDSSLNLAGGDVLESHAVSISQTASGANIAMMLAHIYAEPLRAAVRETVSNALDATIAKWGNHNEIPQVELSYKDGVLSVKDYGVGMDKETLFSAFGAYFASTKKDDMNTIGAYGLGAKAPLAYTDSFTGVTSKDGRTISFIVRKDLEHGVVLDVLSDETTGNTDGTTISFEVDYNKLSDKNIIRDILEGTQLVCLDEKLVDMHDLVEPYTQKYESLGTVNFNGLQLPVYAKVRKNAVQAESDIVNIFAQKDAHSNIIFDVGGILYTKQQESDRKTYRTIIVQVPAGLLSFPSSREHYIYNSTVKNIETVIKNSLEQKLLNLTLKRFGGIGLLGVIIELSHYMTLHTGSFAHQILAQTVNKQFADDTISTINSSEGRTKKIRARKESGKTVISLAYGTETSRYAYKTFIKNLGENSNIYTQGIVYPKKTENIPEAISKLEQILPEGNSNIEVKTCCVDSLLDRTVSKKKQDANTVTMDDAINKIFIKKTDSIAFPNTPSYATSTKMGFTLQTAINLGTKNNTVSHKNAITTAMTEFYEIRDEKAETFKTTFSIDSMKTLQSATKWVNDHAVDSKNILIFFRNHNHYKITASDLKHSDYGLIEKMVETFKTNKNNEMPFHILDIGYDSKLHQNTTGADKIKDITSLILLLAKNLQNSGYNIAISGDCETSTGKKASTTKTINKTLEKTGFLTPHKKTVREYHNENSTQYSSATIWTILEPYEHKMQEKSRFVKTIHALASHNPKNETHDKVLENFVTQNTILDTPVTTSYYTSNKNTENPYTDQTTNKIYSALKTKGFDGDLNLMIETLHKLHKTAQHLPPELNKIALKVDEEMAKAVQNIQL